MRILHLLPTLTGAGAERQVAVRCTGLRDAGDDVMVGYVHHGPGTWPAAVPAHRFTAHGAWSPALVAEIVRSSGGGAPTSCIPACRAWTWPAGSRRRSRVYRWSSTSRTPARRTGGTCARACAWPSRAASPRR